VTTAAHLWRGCAAHSPKGLWGITLLARSGFIVERERTAEHWLIKASTVLLRVTGAESRFSASMRLNEMAMLAAADELEAASREARSWMVGNRCPDLELGRRITLMLNNCTEVAVTAQCAIAGPYAGLDAVSGRLGDLLAVIGLQLQTLDIW
jgi:hypothetical protein